MRFGQSSWLTTATRSASRKVSLALWVDREFLSCIFLHFFFEICWLWRGCLNPFFISRFFFGFFVWRLSFSERVSIFGISHAMATRTPIRYEKNVRGKHLSSPPSSLISEFPLFLLPTFPSQPSVFLTPHPFPQLRAGIRQLCGGAVQSPRVGVPPHPLLRRRPSNRSHPWRLHMYDDLPLSLLNFSLMERHPLTHLLLQSYLYFSWSFASSPEADAIKFLQSVAEDEVGIPSLLDSSSFADVKDVDDVAVITYLSAFHHRTLNKERLLFGNRQTLGSGSVVKSKSCIQGLRWSVLSSFLSHSVNRTLAHSMDFSLNLIPFFLSNVSQCEEAIASVDSDPLSQPPVISLPNEETELLFMLPCKEVRTNIPSYASLMKCSFTAKF